MFYSHCGCLFDHNWHVRCTFQLYTSKFQHTKGGDVEAKESLFQSVGCTHLRWQWRSRSRCTTPWIHKSWKGMIQNMRYKAAFLNFNSPFSQIFDDYYVFKSNKVTKRSVHPETHHSMRLESEPKVRKNDVIFDFPSHHSLLVVIGKLVSPTDCKTASETKLTRRKKKLSCQIVS